jgi:ABC-type Mn2+/Zn2+ transport system ATPase subunit
MGVALDGGPLRLMWDCLDKDQQKAYREFAHTKNNLAMVIGEAGTGKSELVKFTIVNALFGSPDSDKRPKKALIFQPQNTGVNHIAEGLQKA